MDQDRVELLRPTVEALRRALVHFDESDIPAGLQRVADSAARRLPVPLVRRALSELESSEWLRQETLAAWTEPDAAGRMFLERPDGWVDAMEAMTSDRREAVEDRVRSELERDLAAERASSREFKNRLARANKRISEVEEQVRRTHLNDVERAEAGRKRAEDEQRRTAQLAADLEARLERSEGERRSAEQRIDSLRRMVQRERQHPQDVAEPPRRGWFPDSPREMADELDRIVLAVRRAPVGESLARRDPEIVTLPSGVRPDRAEAVRWLLTRPMVWMVDGYNVAFALSDSPDGAVRSRVVAALADLVGLAGPGSAGVVVFDSSLGQGVYPSDRRVRTVFARSADDWIIEQAQPGTVVVSSDRRVREGAEDNGAVGLWSEALAAWIESPTGP